MRDTILDLTTDCYSKQAPCNLATDPIATPSSNHTQLLGAGASNLHLAVDSSKMTQLYLSYWAKQQSRGDVISLGSGMMLVRNAGSGKPNSSRVVS